MPERELGGSRAPRALLARAGVDADTDRDQHFLVDERVLGRLPEYAASFDHGHVLEVGAGTGALTAQLLATAGMVTAIERDRRLARFLRTEFEDEIAAGDLEVVEGDATDVALPAFTASISNLPYGTSSPILFRLLPRRRPLLVMVQRELGERMAAEPGTDAYGRLSVTAQHFAAVEVVETVPPTAFDPQPAVESAVVRTEPRDPSYRVDDEAAFLALVRGVFTQRRKTLRNALRNTTHISGIEDVDGLIAAVDDETLSSRPEQLPPATFAELARRATESEVAG